MTTEKNFPLTHFNKNNVANVTNVATLDIETVAIDPSVEKMQESVSIIEEAIAKAGDDSSVFGHQNFKDALKFIRENDPDLYQYNLRSKIKKAKPSGILLGDIDKDTAPDREDESGSDSVASELIGLVLERGDFYFDESSDTSFVAVEDDGIEQVFQIGTKTFVEWLSYAYYRATENPEKDIRGKSASELAIKQACFALKGICKHEGVRQAVFLRAAPYENGVVIFLADDRLRRVEVSISGWRLVEKSPVKFWMPSTMCALPSPIGGKSIDLLWQYCNIPEHDRPLVLAWMLEAFVQNTPFPVLALNGLQGCAKSSTHDRIRQLIDPNKSNLRAAPKSVEDIYVSAGVNWVVSFENISRLTPQQQDAMCILATGGGYATRTFHTNTEETVIDAKRPIIINSIPVVITAQDLTDRVINIELQPIDYREESEINAAFEKDAPYLFGALLDLFVKTLVQLPKVKLHKPPRMADFTRLGEAMMQATGSEPGTFYSLFKSNRIKSVKNAMESSPVAIAVREMVDSHTGLSEIVFHGTMMRLLTNLAEFRHDTESWPRSARGLGNILKRQSPALSAIGIQVIHGGIQRFGNDRGVSVMIKKSLGGNIGNVGNIVFTKMSDEKKSSDKGVVL